MLHEIRVSNFYSIRDEQTLDLRLAANAPHLDRFRSSHSRSDVRLPTVVAIFGPNASGKSTFLRAITSTLFFVNNSFDLPVDSRLMMFSPFLSSENFYKPTRIMIEFDASWIGGRMHLYRYEIELFNDDPIGPKRVLREALSYAPEGKMRRIFERREQNVKSSKEFGIRASDIRVKSVRPNASVISTLAKLNHEFSKEIYDDISGVQSNAGSWFRSKVDPERLAEYYANNLDTTNNLNRELQRLDIGLVSMNCVSASKGPIMVFLHQGLSSPVIFNDESRGTQRFVEIFPQIHYVLQTGHIAIIDELDSDLHPLLVPEIFRWFQDPMRNVHGAQLLFTAHNAALMDALEKEEVYFTEKDVTGASSIYGAQDIKGLRREPSLMKKYLSGALGAVPQIG